jgi:hypothetical protein
MFGVFVASGVILFFSSRLGIEDWEHPLRGYIVAAFVLSAAVLATHLYTAIYASAMRRRHDRADLKLVPGSPTYCIWSVGGMMMGKRKEPVLFLTFDMSFAHSGSTSIIVRRAYLKGTEEAFPIDEIVVDGPYCDPESICIFAYKYHASRRSRERNLSAGLSL